MFPERACAHRSVPVLLLQAWSLNDPAATSIDAADMLDLGSEIRRTQRELLRVRTWYVRLSSLGLQLLSESQDEGGSGVEVGVGVGVGVGGEVG